MQNRSKTAGDIWQTLSKINLEPLLRKKQKFTYLSWADAWGQLMEHYPQAVYEFLAPITHENGSVEVRCRVSIDNISREMMLPVLDLKNQAVKNPGAADLNKAKMRCLVKAIAMFGLGHFVYAGEDVPHERLSKAASRKVFTDLIAGIRAQTGTHDLKAFYEENKVKFEEVDEGSEDELRREYGDALTFWKDREATQ